MNQLFKRLGALLLVFAMVVGMLPVSVFAAEGSIAKLEVQLQKIDQWAQWEEEYGNEADASRPAKPEKQFAYVATLVDSKIENEKDAEYYWSTNYTGMETSEFLPLDETNKHLDTYYTSDESSAIAVRVHVDGMIQVAVIPAYHSVYNSDHIAKGDVYTWHPTTMLDTVYVGVPFELPEPTFAENGISAGGNGLNIVSQDTLLDTDVFKPLEGNKYVVTSAEYANRNLAIVERKIYAGMADNPPLRYEETVAVEIKLPDLDVKVNDKEPGSHLSSEPIEQFTVSFPGNDGQQWFPEVKYQSVAVEQLNWNYSDGHWTAIINEKCENTEATVSVGDKEWKFVQDSQSPELKILNAYHKGEETKVDLEITAGISGVETVTINEVSHEVNVHDATERREFTIEGLVDQVTVTATSMAGKTATATANVTADLSISVTEGPEEVDGYIQAHKDYVIEIGGLTDDITLEELVLGTDSLVAVSGVKVNSEVANEKVLVATDSLGRTAKYTFKKLTVDNTKPTVTVTAPTGYHKTAQTVTFQINESGVGIADDAYVSYTLKGDSNTQRVDFDASGKAEITVTDGQELVSYTICDVKDKVGNLCEDNGVEKPNKLVVDGQAPKVTVTFNSAVKGVYTDPNGQIFLLVTPVTDLAEGEAEQIEMIVTIEDPNLNGEATYRTSMKVDRHSTDAMPYEFTAIDFAENMAAEAEMTVGNLSITLEADNGKFTGLFAVDRRLPSESGATAIPSVKPVTKAEVQAMVKRTETIEVPLYADDSIEYTVNLTDAYGDGQADSGMKDPLIEVEGGLNCETQKNGDTYTITVKVPKDTETKDAALYITVEDNAGNNFRFHEYFAVDNKAPKVEMSIPACDDLDEDDSVNYYQKAQVVNMAATDLFLDEFTVTVNKEEILDPSRYDVITDVDPGAIELVATDLAGNKATISNAEKLIVDAAEPTITVKILDEKGSIVNGNEFYKGELTYQFAVEDANLKRDTIELSYEIVGEGGAKYTVTADDFDEKNLYSVTIGNRQMLSDYAISATDYSGKKTTKTISEKEKILVDTVVPKLTVTKVTEGPVSAAPSVSYYQKPVTYTITIEDDTITQGMAVYLADIQVENAEGITIPKEEWEVLTKAVHGINGVRCTFTVEAGEILKGMAVTVMDAAGYYPAALEAGSETFKQEGSTFTNSDWVVVDETAPTATLSFAMSPEVTDVELTGFSFNENTKKAYFTLAKKEAAEKNPESYVEITATLTVQDPNLAEYLLKSNEEIGKWQDAEYKVNDAAGTAVFTKTVKVEEGKTGDFKLDFEISDLAGNKLDAQKDVKFEAINGLIPQMSEETVIGKLVIDMVLDYRQPSSGADDAPPEIIVVTPDTSAVYKSNNGRELFDADVVFNTRIKDYNENNAESSGLEKVTYTISDANGAVVTDTDVSMDITNAEHKSYVSGSIPITAKDGTESNDVTLKLMAKDNAGNSISYEKPFAMDTYGPRITGSYDVNDYYLVDGVAYFAEDRVLTLTLDDINNDIENTTITSDTASQRSQWSGTQADAQRTMTLKYTSGEHDKPTAGSVMDKAQNSLEKFEIAGEEKYDRFFIDQKVPEIKVTQEAKKSDPKNKSYTDGKSFDYLNHEVTYTVVITDDYLTAEKSEGQAQDIRISYTINGTEKVVTLAELENTGTAVDTYQYSFDLLDGQVLSAFKVTAVDNAGNRYNVDMEVSSEDHPFSGLDVVVDTTAPVVTVTRGSDYELSQSVNGYDFYKCPVTYTISVSDTNLNAQSKEAYAGNYTITINGNKQNAVAFSVSPDGDEATAQFTVDNETQLDAFELQIKDAAGNTADGIITGAEKGNADTFTVNSTDASVFDYTGNRVVVDTKAPTATLEFVSGELETFYSANGICYIKLKNPITDETREDAKDATVQVILTVTDWNLSFDAAADIIKLKDHTGRGEWTKGTGSWSGDYLVNSDGTARYTRTITVPVNKTDKMELQLNVTDLAGNAMTEAVEIKQINNSVPTKNPLTVENGSVTGTITLDRRQPTADNPEIPEIKLEITEAPYTASNGNPLYDKGEFTIQLKVNEGTDHTLNAGLKDVKWELNNDAEESSFLKTSSDWDPKIKEEDPENYYTHEELITLTPGTGEYNDYVLTVIAIDNVGNEITKTINFAVDNLAPRITVSYDNNSVQNDKYFNETRIATVTVEDINFNSKTTAIKTQVDPTGWKSPVDGNAHKHQTTYVYSVDGDYTFEMSASDLAKNITGNGGVTYEGVATGEFTIDKTAPVIELAYSPDDMTKTDAEQVVYYAENQFVSVIIKEHNFRATDVKAQFYVNRDNPLNKELGNFAVDGDIYTAVVEYDEGNRYKLGVDYTDLAGNHAEPVVSHIFTVDKTAPVINITTEGMRTDALNMVTDELELTFEIEDALENLKRYQVVVTHLNNEFQSYVFDRIELDNLDGDSRKTITISLDDIEKIKINDGLYTVQLIGWDYADNSVELIPELVFSLNRFGSTFTTDDPFTKQFLTPGSDGFVYHNSVDGNLIIQEINPNRVFSDDTMQEEGSSLTIIVNGRSVRLQKGTDYTVAVEKQGEGKSQWYVYTYEIDRSVFQSDNDLLNGRYSILIYGVDEAANDNTNESNEFGTVQKGADGEYSGKIEFVLDTKAPVIITTGIESGEVYNEEYRRMEIEISDSTPTVIQIYLNEELVPLRTDPSGLANNQPWVVQDETTGIYTLNVNEQDGIFASQNVQIQVLDAAGNSAGAEVTQFHVSTSWIVRAINSVWFYVAVVSVAAAGAFVVIRVRKKKVI